MNVGSVVRIRVNPKDTMSVIDLVKRSGLDITGMSFPTMVSLALSASMNTMRENGHLPTRDGFEYAEMTYGILGVGQKSDARKRMINNTVQSAGPRFAVTVPMATKEQEAPAPTGYVKQAGWTPPKQPSLMDRLKRAELTGMALEPEDQAVMDVAKEQLSTLAKKKDRIEEEHSGEQWTEKDAADWAKYYPIVYPFG
jgi:hypothetical protein